MRKDLIDRIYDMARDDGMDNQLGIKFWRPDNEMNHKREKFFEYFSMPLSQQDELNKLESDENDAAEKTGFKNGFRFAVDLIFSISL